MDRATILGSAAILIIACRSAQPGSLDVRLHQPEVRALVDPLIVAEMKTEHLPGCAVVIVQGGSIIHSAGFGIADARTNRPVDADSTIFRIGSISKALTALAVHEMVRTGRIDPNERVSTYIGEPLLAQKYADPVRVRHLLTHTAGFDQTGLGRHARTLEEQISLKQLVEEQVIPIRPPGRIPTYDTYGMVVAGHMIERVSGLPYATYMRERFFGPLGMMNTWVEVPADRRRHLATGYGWNDSTYVPMDYEYYNTTPASSIDASAADMGRLLIAMLGETDDRPSLLGNDPAAVLAQETRAPYAGFPGYAIGLSTMETNGQRIYRHGGTMLGYTSDLVLIPEHRIGWFIVYNRDAEAGGGEANLRDKLAKTLLDDRFPVPAYDGSVTVKDSMDTRSLAGAWASTLYCHTCADGEGWPMYFAPIVPIGPGVIEYEGTQWLCQGDRVFRTTEGDDRIVFFADDRGRVRYLSHGGYDLVREKLDDALLDEVYQDDPGSIPGSALAAQVYRYTERWPEAARAYSLLAAASKTPGKYWYRAGASWMRAGSADSALVAWERAAGDPGSAAEANYGLATIDAAAGRLDRAIDRLGQAMASGLEEPEHIKVDPALDPLRDLPAFRALLRQLK